MKLLYYSQASYGGIADYAHEQANALAKKGVEVYLLTTPHYLTGRGEKYHVLPNLKEIRPDKPIYIRPLKGLHYVNTTLSNVRTLVHFIQNNFFKYVLFGSYSEYFAPLWTPSLRYLAQHGVVFGAVIHDPVRNFVLGPQWWHQWSVASGYSFLREAFVHEAIELNTARPMPHLHTTVIPHGAYQVPAPTLSCQEIRMQYNLPLNAKVMLAFGHLRANKNLDLVIRAMAQVAGVYLVVAGSEISLTQPLAPRYQSLANELGVNERIRWQIRFIPDSEIANFFIASDLVVLAYSKSFRSASGVLNTAASYCKPCIASGGRSNLASVVNRYNLGIWVEPDCLKSLVSGLFYWLEGYPSPNWATYHLENSWEKNAEITLKTLKNSRL